MTNSCRAIKAINPWYLTGKRVAEQWVKIGEIRRSGKLLSVPWDTSNFKKRNIIRF
jgi:hypothetical protein